MLLYVNLIPEEAHTAKNIWLLSSIYMYVPLQPISSSGDCSFLQSIYRESVHERTNNGQDYEVCLRVYFPRTHSNIYSASITKMFGTFLTFPLYNAQKFFFYLHYLLIFIFDYFTGLLNQLQYMTYNYLNTWFKRLSFCFNKARKATRVFIKQTKKIELYFKYYSSSGHCF